MRQIRITLPGRESLRRPPYTVVSSLLSTPKDPSGLPYIGAVVNNEVTSLSYPITADSSVRFVTAADDHGWRIYRNSLSFLLAACVRDLFPRAGFSLQHAVGSGLYWTFETRSATGRRQTITRRRVARLETRLREMVARDLPIERHKLSFASAVARFEKARQWDKLNLLKYRNPPRVVIHVCGDFYDLAHGPLAPGTGSLARFALVHHPPGFVLQLPTVQDPWHVPPFRDQPQLFRVFQEHKRWGRILGVTTVGRLNEIIAQGKAGEIVATSEALHEKKVACIADEIAARAKQVRLVLVAGPSSAGKTTFAKRLAVQLRVNGLRPVTLSTDDYFVARDRTPRDERGHPDFEHLRAIDIPLLNRHLVRLLAGDEVGVPSFNFRRRRREYTGRRLRLEADQVMIIEGIHGLNPELTSMVPVANKFRIYVNALTQLAVDSNNRISTTDNRLMRRLIRDSTFRGNAPLDTLRMWPSVRRGEERWIFPFESEADAAFNSTLDYELAVLKYRAELLLSQIKPTRPEYAEARRLTAFLLNFLPMPEAAVPGPSILREFIGGCAC